MNGFKVLDGGSASEIKEIFAKSPVTRLRSLAGGDVSESMFHPCPLPQTSAAFRSVLQFSLLLPKALVLRDADRPTLARCGMSALRSQRAAAAGFWIEFHHLPWLEVFYLAGWASNGVVPQIEFELCLAKQLLVCVLDLPGFCNHFAASGKNIVEQGAVDVPPVDKQLVDGESLLVQVVLQ